MNAGLSLRAVVILLVGLLALSACGETQQTDDESTALIENYLTALQANDLQRAVAMYPLEQQQQAQTLLQQFAAERGAIQQFQVETIEPNTVYSGRYYLATVKVTTDKGQASTEMVTAFRKLSEDRPYIVSHKIKGGL